MPFPLIPFIVGAVVAGTATSVVGQVKAGRQAKAVGDFNARIAELQAEDAIARGHESAHRHGQVVRGLIGEQRAGFAGQGVNVNRGSAVDVQADTADLGAQDIATIQRNAEREAWGYRVDAQNARLGAANAQSAARWGAAGTILNGGTSLALMSYGWQQQNARMAPAQPTPRTA